MLNHTALVPENVSKKNENKRKLNLKDEGGETSFKGLPVLRVQKKQGRTRED